ncbi:MAG: TatD family hydrolase [Candidatus Omnitrophota bacterium]
MIKLIDTHAHLDFPEYDSDRDEIIKRAQGCGIEYIVNVGSSIQGSKNSLELAAKYSCVYAVVGIHPHDADIVDNNSAGQIKNLAQNDKVKAIGEIGLDYFNPETPPSSEFGVKPYRFKNYSKQENQRLLFKSLLTVAKDLDLPVVLHIRDAHEDTLKIIKEFLPLRAVVHCFSGNEDFLKACLDMGFLVSFTCNITYKKAQNLRDIIKIVPLNSVMLETDCPYLSPEGFRGKRNEPFQVKLLAEYIAKIKEISFEEIARVTTANAMEFFGI